MTSLLLIFTNWEWFFGAAFCALAYNNITTLLQAYKERREERGWEKEYRAIDKTPREFTIDKFLDDIKKQLNK